ncbi:MAG: ABC transporter ATP-binding protein [Cyclobacteriaceae bacterium]
MKTSQSFIQLIQVSKSFSAAGSGHQVLNQIDIDLTKGSFTVIQGASGSGKSTLLNILSGIDQPSNGEIWVDQVPVHSLSSVQLARWRGKQVGIVFQFFQLMPTLTVLENIILPMEFVGVIPKRERKARAQDLLEQVGVDHLANKFPHTLSGGEKQRTAIARALANDPSVIVADEPTGNLDSQNSAMIHQMFDQLHADGKTIIYVTHEQQLPTSHDRRIWLEDGKVQTVDNRREVLV